MILAAAVCPHPPLLFRELTGQRDVAAGLRHACREAVGDLLSLEPDRVVVVGGADRGGAWDPALPPDVHGFGTTEATPADAPDAPLPLSLGVGRRLLDDAGWSGATELRSVRWEAGVGEVQAIAAEIAALPGRVALLVLGEGSARRGEKAPGYLDERSFGFDDRVADALREGRPDVLRDLDAALAGDLMVLGRAAFAVLGDVVASQDLAVEPRLLRAEDPFGVMYLVASWRLRRAGVSRGVSDAD